MVVEGKVFNDFPRFIDALIVKFAVGGAFNLALKMKGDMIIENLNLKPTIDAMMRDFLESDLSRLRPVAVVNFLTPSLDRLRRRHFVIGTSSPRSVCTILQEIWCRGKAYLTRNMLNITLLNEVKDKIIEDGKDGEFGRSFPNIGENRSRYRMGPPGYYMRTDNRPPFGERKSLEETIYKYLEESTKKQAEHDN
ncbi:hypothetical protein Tco_0313742 [Tanacetum coccineum]